MRASRNKRPALSNASSFTRSTCTMPSIFFRRIAAYLIDILILFVVLAPLGGLVQFALGIWPTTPQEIYATLLLNFSIPAWAYFTLSDRSIRGATIGKRLLKIQTDASPTGRIGTGQALARTAVKMLPWELTHASMFLFAAPDFTVELANGVGVGVTYALSFLYLVLAWRSDGRRSLHDLLTRTQVTPASSSTVAT
ncbi:MAG: hypothetical protein Rubg2KO_24720 [Rubricoccaceae bacterium]